LLAALVGWVVAMVFFFQAEDGIRDFHVTGVQTCALPISVVVEAPDLLPLVADRPLVLAPFDLAEALSELLELPLAGEVTAGEVRSEERRVGKEWRMRAAGDEWREKNREEGVTYTEIQQDR